MSIGCLLVLLLSACRGDPQTTGGGVPQRIIAVSPGAVETLFALDLGERVVGVGSYAHWPVEVEKLARIGGLYDPRFETIVGLEPDLAILLASEAELATALEKLGIPNVTIPHETIADVGRAATAIAEAAGVPERAERFVAALDSALTARGRPIEARVLLSVARQSGRGAEIYAAGPDTFLGELVDRLGASHIVSDLPQLYPRLAFEEAALRRPEVVIELQPETVSAAAAGSWRRDWLEVSGEEGPCVVIVDGSHVLLPGPRLPELYRDLEEALLSCAAEDKGR